MKIPKVTVVKTRSSVPLPKVTVKTPVQTEEAQALEQAARRNEAAVKQTEARKEQERRSAQTSVADSPLLAPLKRTQGSTYLTGGTYTPAPSYGAGAQARELKDLNIKPREKKPTESPQAQVTAPAWVGLMDLSQDELERRHAAKLAERDAVSKLVQAKEREGAGPNSTYAASAGLYKPREENPILSSAAASSGAWVSPVDKELAALKVDEGRKQHEVSDLANAQYHRRNQDALVRLANDTTSKTWYNSAKELVADLEVLERAVNMPTAYNGHDVRFSGDGEKLLRKYGATDLQALKTDLAARKAKLAEELKAKGYDFEDILAYDRMLEREKTYLEMQGKWQKEAEEHPFWSSWLSVVFSPLQGFDYLRTVGNSQGHNNADDLSSYRQMDPYDMAATNMVQTTRGTVSRMIEEKGGPELFGQNVAAFLYNTGMSMADSALMVTTLGSASTVLMGLSSAANTSKEIMERGGSNEDAIWGGFAAGAAELIFEKVSVEHLLKIKDVKGWKNAVKVVLKQGGVEASEEMMTEIANILSDAMLGDRSKLAEAAGKYESRGLSQNDAWLRATLDSLGDVAWAGAGGFVSGAGMAGGKMAFQGGANAIYNSFTGRQSRTAENATGTGVDSRLYADVGVDSPAIQNPAEGAKNAPVEGARNEAGLVAISEREQAQLSTGKRNLIAGTVKDIVDFAKSALAKKGGQERLYMGIIPDSTAQRILAATGIDVTGYKAILTGDSVQHTRNRHGDPIREQARGQRVVTADDYGMIPQVLANPDSVELADGTDSSGRRVILFSKQIGDVYVTAQAVTDSRHALTTDTMWIQKRKSHQDTTPDAGSYATGPVPNARSAPSEGSSTNSIPQTAQEVNPEGGDGMTNSVGAAAAGFTTPGAPHGTRVSGQADTTLAYNDQRGAAASRTRAEWNESLRYEVQSHEQWTQWAGENLFAEQDGKRLFLRDIDPAGYQELLEELRAAPAWNATMVKTADMIEQELRRRAAEPDMGDANAVNEAEYRAFVELKADKTRETARGLAAANLWEEGANDRGAATERTAWDALEQSGLSPEERLEKFRAIVKFDQDIERAGADAEALRGVILEIGRARGVLDNSLTGKESALLNKLTAGALESLNAGELRQFAYASSAALVGDVRGSDLGAKLKTIQVLNMLSNPKTAMRNLVGDTTFTSLDAMTMRGAALLDMALSNLTGTRSIAMEGSVLSKESRAAISKAIRRSIAEITLDVDMGAGNRYTGKGRRTFQADGGIVERVLSSMERNMGYLLTTTDEAYKGAARATEGATQRLVDEGKIKTNDPKYAQKQAEALAKYRTFQNDTVASAALQGIHDFLNMVLGVGDSGKKMFAGKLGKDKAGKTVHAFGAGDMVSPFTRVAANLVTVGVDYSPVNAVKGAAEIVGAIADRARGGSVDPAKQAKGVSDMTRGLTGTALAYGFYLLASAGLIRRAEDEGDEDVAAMNRSEGMVGTQVNVSAMQRALSGGSADWQEGDTLIDLSSVEPVNMILDMGLEMSQLRDEGGGILSTFGGASVNSTLHAAQDLPVLQGVSEVGKDVFQYHKNPFIAVLEQAGGTAVSSVTPNWLASVAKGLDDKQRSTRSTEKEGWGAAGDFLLDTFKSRIPGLRETLPTVTGPDGREKDNPGGMLERMVNAMLNPVGVNEYTQSDVSREMARVREETGRTDFYPQKRTEGTLEYTDKQGEKHYVGLSYEQRQRFQATRSATQLAVLSDMMGSRHYKNADAEAQAELLNACREYAYEKAKAEALDREEAGGGYEIPGAYRKAETAREAGALADYYFYKLKLKEESERLGNKAAGEALRRELFADKSLTDKQKGTLDELLISDTVIIPKDVKVDYSDRESFIITQMSEAAQRKWNRAKELGYTAEEYETLYGIYSQSSKKKEEKLKELRDAGLTRREAEAFWRAMGKEG